MKGAQTVQQQQNNNNNNDSTVFPPPPSPISIDWRNVCVTSSACDPERARLNQMISELSEYLGHIEDVVNPCTPAADLPLSAEERTAILENAVEAASCMNILAVTIKNMQQQQSTGA